MRREAYIFVAEHFHPKINLNCDFKFNLWPSPITASVSVTSVGWTLNGVRNHDGIEKLLEDPKRQFPDLS
jgi:hypothetical protein